MDEFVDVTIRAFSAGDRPAVEAFFDQMGGESRAFFNRNDGNRRFALRFFEEEPSPRVVRFLAETKGRMIGYVFLGDLHTRVPWLGIAVAEDYKGRHLGRRLIQHAHDYARQVGAGGVMLTTSYGNTRGLGLYERMGYERLGMHASGEIMLIYRFPAS